MEINETKSALSPDQIVTPSLQSVISAGKKETEFSVGTVDESLLTDEEREAVERIASEIAIDNVEQVVNYGIKAQTNISEFSTSILKKVRTYDLGDVGESLRDLTIALDATIEPEKKGFLGIFQKAKRGIGVIRANYAKAESNVDRIERDLQKQIRKFVLTDTVRHLLRKPPNVAPTSAELGSFGEPIITDTDWCPFRFGAGKRT